MPFRYAREQAGRRGRHSSAGRINRYRVALRIPYIPVYLLGVTPGILCCFTDPVAACVISKRHLCCGRGAGSNLRDLLDLSIYTPFDAPDSFSAVFDQVADLIISIIILGLGIQVRERRDVWVLAG